MQEPSLRVSVVIPAYNAAGTIAAAIESAVRQTKPALEIIVVDDGSADGTLEVVRREFGGLVTLEQQPNRGPGSARNRGIAAASGNWIGFLDADDEWLPRKLELQAPYTLPADVAVVCGGASETSLGFASLWERNRIATSSVLLRREAFYSVGRFDEDRSLIGVEDYNLWLRLAASGWRLVSCPHYLIRYQPTAGSLTRQLERFAAAELANVAKLAESSTPCISARAAAVKEQQVLITYGQDLLHVREMWPARRLFARAAVVRPSLRALAWFLVSLFPRRLLDMRRRARRLPEPRRGRPDCLR